MNTQKAPWYAGLLFALLTALEQRYPEYRDTINMLLNGLIATWAVHLTGTVKNGNGR